MLTKYFCDQCNAGPVQFWKPGGIEVDNGLRDYIPVLVSLAVSLMAFVVVSVADWAIIGTLPHDEGPPSFSWYHMARIAIAAALSFWIAAAIPWKTAGPATRFEAFSSTGLAAVSALTLWAMIGVFVISPELFSLLSEEDGLVEWLSFSFSVGASILFAAAAVSLRRRQGSDRVAYIFAAGIAVLLFVIGMEEVSWFQRVFVVETPDMFTSNMQNEINLHNFATDEFENLYYVGSFSVLGLLPFLAACVPSTWPHYFRTIAPNRAVAMSCLAMVACSWEMWNIIPIQMTFWVSVFLLANFARQHLWGRWPALFLVASMVLAQLVFLRYGWQFVRSWDLTEYREMFISFGFLIYAIGMFSSVRNRSEIEP